MGYVCVMVISYGPLKMTGRSPASNKTTGFRRIWVKAELVSSRLSRVRSIRALRGTNRPVSLRLEIRV